jgi:ketosteroid isomerase-like protein
MPTTVPSTRSTSDLSITTTDHPNAIRIREGFAAFSRGDLDHVRATMTPDCAWTNSGASEVAGTFRGWDEIVGMFGALIERTGGTLVMDVVSTLGDDTHAVALYDMTSTIAGVTETHRFALIEELTADGRAATCTGLAYDQAAADAHFART